MIQRLRHFSSTISSNSDRLEVNTQENNAKFRVTEFYHNNSKQDIIVTKRNNLPILLTKSLANEIHNQRLTVTRRYKFGSTQAVRDAYKLIKEFKKYHGCEHSELTMLEVAIEKEGGAAFLGSHKFIDIVYELPFTELYDDGQAYDRRTDLLITLQNVYSFNPHPFSDIGKGFDEYKDYIQNKKGSGTFIEIVDNNDLVTKRYCWIANELKEVYPIKDDTKDDGIYVTRFCHMNNGDIDMQVQNLDLSDGVKVGLYPTREEAVTNGRTDENLRNEKMKLEHDRIKLERETLEAKTNFRDKQIELDNLKQEAEEIKHRNQILEHRLEQETFKAKTEYVKEKDNHESKSLQRSETVETLKFISTTLTGLITIFLLMKK